MKTKSILQVMILAAAMLGPVAWQASAQGNVYSLNVVGYYNVTLSPGWNLMAIQLDQGNNYNANAVLYNSTAADGSLLYRFNPTSQGYYDAGTYLNGVGWYPLSGNTNDSVLNLPLGEGFFIWTPQSWIATIVGSVPQGRLINPVPANYSLKASLVPQAGLLSTDLSFPRQDGDQVWRWVSPGFTYSFYDFDFWDPTEPTLGVGEGFVVYPTSPETWSRNFTVQSSPSPQIAARSALSASSVSPPLTPVINGLSLASGYAVLNFSASAGRSYYIQFAQNSAGPFLNVGTMTASQTSAVWQDPTRAGVQGYYRLMLIP